MSGQMPFQLTDPLIERMLAEQAGTGLPAGLVQDIVAAVEATPQRRAGLLPRLAWPGAAARTPARLLVGLTLLAALMLGAAIAGWMLLRQDSEATPPLLVYQVRGDFADVLLLDAATGTETLLGSVQVTAPIGGQRVDWAADGRHAIVFGDTDLVQARVDVAARAIAPLDLRDPDGQQDAVSPAGDQVARLVGDAERGLAVSVVDLEGAELARIALPEGAEAMNEVAWAPDATAVVVSACVGCAADASDGASRWSLLLVPLDGTSIRTLAAPAGVMPSQARFSPDGGTIAFAGGDGIWLVEVADGRFARLTTNEGGRDESPAWSPDGERIAFARSADGGTGGGLFVVGRDGGNLVRLTDVGGFGPVWSPDGTSIAYTRDNTDTSLGDLWVVPSSGGGEARLLRTNAVADWGPTPPADLAPYPARPGEGATPSAEPSTEPPTPMPSPLASASPAASGPPAGSTPLGGGLLLVWRLDGLNGTEAKTETVYTLDVGTGEETVIGTLPVNENTCCPGPVQWSSDRRQAFLSQERGLQAIVDVEAGTIDRVGKPPAGQFKEAISNRGDRIARVDEVSGTAPTIVVSRVNGKELQRIPLPSLDFVEELAWSPDDTALAVVGATGDEPETVVSRLLVAELDGSPPRELSNNAAGPVRTAPPVPTPTPGPADHRPPGLRYWRLDRAYLGPRWSPDGRTIAVADRTCFSGSDPDFTGIRLQRDCRGRLLGIDVASGAQTVLVEGDLVPGPAAWSPDGRRIAFGQAAADGSNPGIFAAASDGGNVTRLADGDEDVQWSPDGTWLAFTRWDWDLPQGIGADHAQLWVVLAAGGPAKLIAAPATGGW
jgi:Tol biopolymer transport system component